MDPLFKILIVCLAVALMFELAAILALFRYYSILNRRVRFGGGINAMPRDGHLPQVGDRSKLEDRRQRMTSRRKTTSGIGDCASCTAMCCRYLTIPLDEPTAPEDFDWVRYAVSHEGVLVYIEDGEWYLEIGTSCRQLTSDHRCDIYDVRPKICREYSREGCDQTAKDLAEFEWDGYWTSVDRFEQWLDEEMGDIWRTYLDRQRQFNTQAGRVGVTSGGNGKLTGHIVTPTVRGNQVNHSRGS